ncbi:transmembrane amino acid transporter protein-domain-containing protein [Pavlovales sp. CCMP2436]|nr:transmembrane amino acid transporter protein-domain-containing protein [Pavlovales sp. CCMP2436]|mmetsp:Transcript_1871/g.4957  ORF Transcript_1871/g.4957 Transcript_1871/m.4957 type:complete len:467 (+) Transcript_1871:169-1569(+)
MSAGDVELGIARRWPAGDVELLPAPLGLASPPSKPASATGGDLEPAAGLEGPRTLSSFGAGAALLKSMVGSGVLALPWALSRFGLLAGLLGLAVLAIVNVVAIRLLIACRVRIHEQSAEQKGAEADNLLRAEVGRGDGALELSPYEAVAQSVVGTQFARVTTFALIAAQLGVVTVYVVVIAATTQAVLPWVPRAMIIAAMWLWLSGCGFMRGLSEVAWLAVAGLCCYMTVVVGLLHYGVPCIAERSLADLSLFVPAGFGWWYGVSLYSFEGIGTVLPIFEEMKSFDRPERFVSVVNWTYAAAFVFYFFVGSVGYMAYGEEVEDVILFNFPDSLLTRATAHSMAFMMLFSSVVQLYPLQHLADQRYAALAMRPVSTFSLLEKCVLRGLVALLPACVASVAPSVSTIVDLVGASCFSFLGVVAPAVMYLSLFRTELDPVARVALYCLGAFGLVGGVLGTLTPLVMARR